MINSEENIKEKLIKEIKKIDDFMVVLGELKKEKEKKDGK